MTVQSCEDRDNRYLEVITRSIGVCAAYKPRMGHGATAGLDLADFQSMYRNDPFYTWFGLDNPLMYAAHKAAGGMTSIYRQIGMGCEKVFRLILQDELGLSDEESRWSYSVTGANKKQRTLSLDGRIAFSSIKSAEKKKAVREWMLRQGTDLDVDPVIATSLQGIVFEVRQGYKSKDSKSQNADIANAATAYTKAYLPCVVLMSNQIDSDILVRYRSEKWAVLTASPAHATSLNSTYVFMRETIGYDWAGFFERHSAFLREEVAMVLEKLLKAG